MILSELKVFVKQRGEVSLTDIVNHFDTDPQAVRGMLEFWINKGKLKRIDTPQPCKGSCSCQVSEAAGERYRWNPQLDNISIETRN